MFSAIVLALSDDVYHSLIHWLRYARGVWIMTMWRKMTMWLKTACHGSSFSTSYKGPILESGFMESTAFNGTTFLWLPQVAVLEKLAPTDTMHEPISVCWFSHDSITVTSSWTRVSTVCSTVCSGAGQTKYQSSASLALVRGIYRWIPLTKGQ